MQPIWEHTAVAPDRDHAVGGLTDEGGRAAQAAILDGVFEEVETTLVVHGELGRDEAGFLEGEPCRFPAPFWRTMTVTHRPKRPHDEAAPGAL